MNVPEWTAEAIKSAVNAKAKRKPIAIAADGDESGSNSTVLCDDGSVWLLWWDSRKKPAGWTWERIPDVPQDEDEPA